MDREAFRDTYGVLSPLDWWRLVRIRACLPPQWRATIRTDFHSIADLEYDFPPVPKVFDSRLNGKRDLVDLKSRFFYNELISVDYEEPTSQLSWRQDLYVDACRL